MKRKNKQQPQFKRKTVKPKNDNQQKYINLVHENKLVICTGPAGVGKTAVAAGLAVEYLTKQLVERIIITRPAVETGERLGSLPGDLEDKMWPYMDPIESELLYYSNTHEMLEWKNNGMLEVRPLAYMRGSNFHKSFVICGESQNATRKQLIMLLTRIGKSSKMIIEGDPFQSDLPVKYSGFLHQLSSILTNKKDIGVIRFTKKDIVRENIVSEILSAIEEWNNTN